MSERASGENDYGALYSRHKEYVYRLCRSILLNGFDAEDATEDVFVNAIRYRIVFNDETHERKWLTVASINVCKNKLKRSGRTAVSPLEDAEDLSEDIGEKSEVLDAVLSLPLKYREVIWLYYYEGYNANEISTMLKKPASTVRGHIGEARLLLRRILENDDG